MEPQPVRRRRPESVRFPVSSPDLSDTQQSRPISGTGGVRASATSESVTTAQNVDNSSTDDQSAQPRKQHLRQSRFRGLPILPRSITPTSGALTMMNNNEFPSTDVTNNSSPSEIVLDSKIRRASSDLGILQEVSNSTLGRKRSRRQDAATFFDSASSGLSTEEFKAAESYPTAVEHLVIPSSNIGSTIMANSSLPLRSDLLKTPHARLRIPRTNTPQRPAGTESEKYIEHLESQLAALQTRLQALTSPSTSKTQSAKLRAVTSESRALRQEVMEWERKFHERISEQLEQHEMVVGSLKTQIRSLQKELESSNERVTELAVESADKDRLIMAAEGANYDLERRLEFMSEMLAHSPSKLQTRTDIPVDHRRISAPRPHSRGHVHTSAVHNRQTSVQRDTPVLHQREPLSSPESMSRKSMVYAWEENPFDRSMVEAAAMHSNAELDSAALDTTLLDSVPISPAGRRSHGRLPQSDGEVKTRPTRRMRRFYTGSMGPRSLILPSATQVSSTTSSPPTTGSQTPLLAAQPETNLNQHYQFGFKLPVSPERPQLHVRSATWDDNEASSTRSRKSIVSQAPLPLPSPSRSSAVSHSPLSSAPSFLDADALTPVASHQNSAQSVIQRDVSYGSMQGRNLFEELSRIKRLSAGGKARPGPGPTIAELLELENSPAGEALSENADPGNTIPHTIMNNEHVITHVLDLSVEPDNSSAIEIVPQPDVQPRQATTTTDTINDKNTPLRPNPTSLIDRLLNFVSCALDVSTPSVSNVISNAWSIVTLSRPVLEFRWWLVRLLVGGLRKKRRLKLLAARSPPHSLGISSSPGLVSSVVPNTAAAATSMEGVVRESIAPERGMVIMKEIRTAQGYHHPDDDGNELESLNGDADDECERRRRNFTSARIGKGERSRMPKPVAWLKFSMTLVFAVGVAIRDGPASLFSNRAATRNGWECVHDVDDDGDGYG